MEGRLGQENSVFNNQRWRFAVDATEKGKVYDAYQVKVVANDWNLNKNGEPVVVWILSPAACSRPQVPIIPTIHGTNADVAFKICSTGFSALSTLDEGYYGKGIYFTSSAHYALPVRISNLQFSYFVVLQLQKRSCDCNLVCDPR